MVKVGVVFASLVDDPGDYLADARALETAGVDSVWVQAATGGDLLLAAIAAVTSEVRLGLLMEETDRGSLPDDRLETLRRLSRSRVLVGVQTGDTLQAAAEHWRHVAVPRDRAEWQEILAGAEAAGVTGVLLDQHPRLLDLLRRPLEEDDRSDLLLSQG
jgi:2-methylisocitrate lyase-like PEP mutase family enzyme